MANYTYLKGQALIESSSSTSTSGATTTLLNSSNTNQIFTGTLTQTITLPDAATLNEGKYFFIINESTQDLTVQDFSASILTMVAPKESKRFDLNSNVWAYDLAHKVNDYAQSFSGDKTFSNSVAITQDFSTKISADNTSVGILNDVNTDNSSFIRFIASTQITGLANGFNGKELTLTNKNSVTTTVKNNSGSSLAANRILTGTGMDLNLGAGASIKLKYDSVDSVWRIVGGVGGSATSLLTFANDAAFVSFKGQAAAAGDIYENTTDKLIHYYDGTTWQILATSTIGYQEIPSGSGTIRTVSFLPITGTLMVFVDGLRLNISEYSFVNPIIALGFSPSPGQNVEVFYMTSGVSSTMPVASGNYVVFTSAFTNTDITNKSITLPSTPSVAAQLIFDVRGGAAGQMYGIDYTVSSNILTWNGLGLDGQVISGQYYRATYFT